MSVRRIIQTFEAWRETGEALALATVFETSGSTYSKAGHRILIAANGDYQGLVSGGCLEGDVAERARRVLESGESASVTYDLRGEGDELWGLGIGCNGLIRIFLQPLYAEAGYEPFASMAAVLQGTRGGAAALVIEGGRSGLPKGAGWVRGPEADCRWRLESLEAGSGWLERLAAGCERVFESGNSLYLAESGAEVLFAPLHKLPRVLVLGAGLDAIPVVEMAAALGWFVTVADHRPAYLERGGFARADCVIAVEPGGLRRRLRLDDYDAVLVMSHHLPTDKAYLGELAGLGCRYLGVLGPPGRKERLLGSLGPAAGPLRGRLRGPVGLDIGADSPESIALSILAELQAVLAAPAASAADASPRRASAST
ncbi:MAG TPA: XdhC family protein [Gammaproteobacteria bacterium]|nr:XdhC family protein [Gammaproteobacteria bacterium]